MTIEFADKDMADYAQSFQSCQGALGKIRAKKLFQRLGQLNDIETLEEARALPGRFHELRENRKGQWACSLDEPYRLIFEPLELPIPITDNGVYLWSEIRGVRILEIMDYH